MNTRTIIDGETGEVFDAPREEQTGGALSTVSAEIGQQVATAKRFPRQRDIELAGRITDRSTLDEETANECMYSIPRGNKPIEGPSSRFAEIVQQVWGNNRVSGSVSHIDRENGRIFAEGIYLDLETNSATRIVIDRRIASLDKRTGKDRLFSEDMIHVTGTAALSIAKRNAILQGVPKVVWRRAFDAVRKVVMGDIKTLTQRRAAALTEFQRYGITAAQLLALLQVKDQTEIDQNHLLTLRGTLAALRNGETTVEEILATPGKVDVPSAGAGVSGGYTAAPGEKPNAPTTGSGVSGSGTPERQAAQTARQDQQDRAMEGANEATTKAAAAEWGDTQAIAFTANAMKALKGHRTAAEVANYVEHVLSQDGVPRRVVLDIRQAVDARIKELAAAAAEQEAAEKAAKAKADKEAKAAAKAAEKAASEDAAKGAQATASNGNATGGPNAGPGGATPAEFKPTQRVFDKADKAKNHMTVLSVNGDSVTCSWEEDGKAITATFRPRELEHVQPPAQESKAAAPAGAHKPLETLATEMRQCKSQKLLNEYFVANVEPYKDAFDGEDLRELAFIKDRRMKLLVAE